jgi:hypothetical protein
MKPSVIVWDLETVSPRGDRRQISPLDCVHRRSHRALGAYGPGAERGGAEAVADAGGGGEGRLRRLLINVGIGRMSALSDDRYLNQLKMPQSAVEALARAVPDDVVRDIVRDHYKGAVPTPPPNLLICSSGSSGQPRMTGIKP